MRKTVVLFALVLSFVTLARAQGPAPPVAPARPTQPPRPTQPVPPVAPAPPPAIPDVPPPPPVESTQNIELTLTISDSSDAAAKKTVTMLLADNRNGRIRSSGGGNLNVDARADIRKDSRVQLSLTLQYLPRLPENPSDRVNNLDESLNVLLISGKPTVISQSADPTTDRKVTVEVTATLAK
jgi:hypothetical protein